MVFRNWGKNGGGGGDRLRARDAPRLLVLDAGKWPSDQWGGPQCSPQGNITILISTTHRKTKTSRLNRLLHLKRWVKSTRPCCRKCAPHFWRQTSTSEWWRSWGRTWRSALTLRRWHRLDRKKNQILTVLDHFWQGLNKRRMIQQAVFRELVALVEPGVCCH